MSTYKYNWPLLTESISTALLLGNVLLTALNIFPANIIVGVLGSIGWFIVSCLWRKLSLMIINGLFAAIYLYGIVHYFY